MSTPNSEQRSSKPSRIFCQAGSKVRKVSTSVISRAALSCQIRVVPSRSQIPVVELQTMQGVTRSQDPELGPAVSKYPPSSGYGDSHARTHTYGHMHRDQQFSAPEAVDGLYPSGFPRQSAPHRRTSRTADRMMFRFKQDPDVELRPVVPGTMVRTRHVMTKTFRTSTSPLACCCSVHPMNSQ